jgi:hypothetical protein
MPVMMTIFVATKGTIKINSSHNLRTRHCHDAPKFVLINASRLIGVGCLKNYLTDFPRWWIAGCWPGIFGEIDRPAYA